VVHLGGALACELLTGGTARARDAASASPSARQVRTAAAAQQGKPAWHSHESLVRARAAVARTLQRAADREAGHRDGAQGGVITSDGSRYLVHEGTWVASARPAADAEGAALGLPLGVEDSFMALRALAENHALAARFERPGGGLDAQGLVQLLHYTHLVGPGAHQLPACEAPRLLAEVGGRDTDVLPPAALPALCAVAQAFIAARFLDGVAESPPAQPPAQPPAGSPRWVSPRGSTVVRERMHTATPCHVGPATYGSSHVAPLQPVCAQNH